MINVIAIRVKDGRQLVYKIYCVHLFLIQEWESNAGATEGNSLEWVTGWYDSRQKYNNIIFV